MTLQRLALILAPLCVAFVPRPALASADGGRLTVRQDASGVIEVVGLDANVRQAFARPDRTPEGWAEILSVRVAREIGQPQAAAIVGHHEIIGETLRFTPRYPFLAGTRYLVRFDPRRVDPASTTASIELTFTVPAGPVGKPTDVVAVFPSASLVPENLLKLYLHFSAPMSRGEAYHRVRLLDGSGHAVERPFLELGEELWDPEMIRLTLLFDPGRIKRGLKPREDEGPILEAGKPYTLVIDADWPDASNRPLGAGFRKSFRAGPPDEAQPVATLWTFEAPTAGTRGPLVVRFPESLDHAMLGRAISVLVGEGRVVGRVEVGERERSWRFVPDRVWPDGPIRLQVDPELEDLAGNSLARPFEVDEVRRDPGGVSKGDVVVPVPRPR